MPTIRFVRDYAPKFGGGKSFSQGDVVECSADTAGHYTRRQVAELVEAKPKPEPVKKAAPVSSKTKKAVDNEQPDKSESV